MDFPTIEQSFAVTPVETARVNGSVAKTFVDLNGDSVMHIFNYLTINDVINAAEVYHEVAHIMSSLVSNYDKHGSKHITMFNDPTSLSKPCHSLRLLRNFGHLLTSLTLYLRDSKRYFDKEIDDHIIGYCTETLTKIVISNIHEYTMYKIHAPFANVKSLILQDGHLGKHLDRLNKWFPKLEQLELLDLNIEDPHCIEDNFPFMYNVVIHNPEIAERDVTRQIFNNSNLNICFQLNPQIQRLGLKPDEDSRCGTGDTAGIILNEEFLRSIQRKLPQLEKLDLTVNRMDVWNAIPEVNINFPQLQEIRIYCSRWIMLRNIPIECPTLAALHLICENDSADFEVIRKVLEKYSSITSLGLHSEDRNFSWHSLRIITTILPNLRILEIFVDSKRELDTLSKCITQLRSLTKVTVLYGGKRRLDRQEFEQTFPTNHRWQLEFGTKTIRNSTNFYIAVVYNFVTIEKTSISCSLE